MTSLSPVYTSVKWDINMARTAKGHCEVDMRKSMSNTQYGVSAKCSPSLCPQGCCLVGLRMAACGPPVRLVSAASWCWGEGRSDAPLGTGSFRTSAWVPLSNLGLGPAEGVAAPEMAGSLARPQTWPLLPFPQVQPSPWGRPQHWPFPCGKFTPGRCFPSVILLCPSTTLGGRDSLLPFYR